MLTLFIETTLAFLMSGKKIGVALDNIFLR